MFHIIGNGKISPVFLSQYHFPYKIFDIKQSAFQGLAYDLNLFKIEEVGAKK